jgi:YD repeat-containing protein
LPSTTRVQDALGDLTTAVFDAAGNVSATVDARGNRTTYAYDARNMPTQGTRPADHVIDRSSRLVV